ncbi:rifampin ADP-ribosyl transferase [Rhizobium sp. J15]|uniref:NAD(+)--rifampin ADP-ribosyltransferase n=1 Tax=Rhizobium sp. J15 TaxID=2035450 RepID=UPI000BE80D85|nr:NAD(+)--rifampin ADP-ribosyltransferase [Rhizobium sp. J15]PDT15473.1 rifampin ADP-ribosyl transferase [Rhizobium sp. J15]
MSHAESNTPAQPFLHGTKADLTTGDMIKVGYKSNFTTEKLLSWVYFTCTIEAATWGAELATGEGRGRIYVVKPTGPFEDDPNLTDKKFPGNPTQSYRSREPLLVIGEVTDWQPHTAQQLQQMKDGLTLLRAEGKDIIID